VTLRVAVKMTDEKAARPKNFNFIPLSTEGWGPLDEGTPGSEADMTRAGLPPGWYRTALMRMPGYAVSAIAFNGATLLPGSAFDLESAESLLTFTLTTEVSSITGIVRGSDQQPVADATVVLESDSHADAGDDSAPLPPGAGELVTSDAGGRFAFTDLAPGRYRVIALAGGEAPRGVSEANLIRERMRTANTVTVNAQESANVEIRLER
jgi:hypothetical protein